jgi:hypothetical protein
LLHSSLDECIDENCHRAPAVTIASPASAKHGEIADRGYFRYAGTMEKIPVETVAEDMFQMVSECAGKKNLKAGDLTKAMIAKYGEEAVTKDDCKQAIRMLIDSGRCVYSYLGGSYIQLPPKESV